MAEEAENKVMQHTKQRYKNLIDISVYASNGFTYIVGQQNPSSHQGSKSLWSVLKLSTNPETPDQLDATLAGSYCHSEVCELLRRLHEGNKGGLKCLTQNCDALVGCFRWTSCYYLLLVKRKRLVGKVCGANVYGIDSTLLLPLAPNGTLPPAGLGSEAEQRYRRFLSLVTLDKDFFFSYDWPIWCTTQQVLSSSPIPDPFSSDRVWNAHISAPLRQALGTDAGVVPLIHGYFRQKTLSLLGRPLTLTLIARRSRQFAGTRYLKRGINDAGHVANDVESEQVVEAGVDRRTKQPLVSSVVQVRGSVPLYWSQTWSDTAEGSPLKPAIKLLQHLDPLCTATSKHFMDLQQRFGAPLICLNLMKQSDSRAEESTLGKDYRSAVMLLNRKMPPEQRIQYVAWDLSRHAKAHGKTLLHDLQQQLLPLLHSTGVFVAASRGSPALLQHGVLRVNCVDCLDRTNIAQFAFGLLALGAQLQTLGISDSPVLDADSSLADQLTYMYEECGHQLALQYGGSEAHTGFFFQRRRGDWLVGSKDLLRSFQRFYSNVVSDDDKQQAINLFLGSFVPVVGEQPSIWEMDNGYDGGLRGVPSSRRAAAAVGAAGLAQSQQTGVPRPSDALHRQSQKRAPVVSFKGVHGDGVVVSTEPMLEPTLSNASALSTDSDEINPALADMVAAAAPEDYDGAASTSTAAVVATSGTLSSPQRLTRLYRESSADVPASDAGDDEVTSADVDRMDPFSALKATILAGSRQLQAGIPVAGLPRADTMEQSGARLESFDHVLPGVHQVRLIADPNRKKTGGSSWLSPTKQQPPRPSRAFTNNSGSAINSSSTGSGVPGGGKRLEDPPRRLMRSNSEGGAMSSVFHSTASSHARDSQQYPWVKQAVGLRQSKSAVSVSDLTGSLVLCDPYGQLVYSDEDEIGGPGSPGSVLPSSNSRYHRLASLNLEGLQGSEFMVQGPPLPIDPSPAVPARAGAPLLRRLSHASFVALKQLTRGGTTATLASKAADPASAPPQPSLGPALSTMPRLNHPAGAAAPSLPSVQYTGRDALSMSNVLYQREAVRRGIDTLGLPPAVSPLWFEQHNAMQAMAAHGEVVRREYERYLERLSRPLSQGEVAAMEERYAEQLRPKVFVTMAKG